MPLTKKPSDACWFLKVRKVQISKITNGFSYHSQKPVFQFSNVPQNRTSSFSTKKPLQILPLPHQSQIQTTSPPSRPFPSLASLPLTAYTAGALRGQGRMVTKKRAKSGAIHVVHCHCHSHHLARSEAVAYGYRVTAEREPSGAIRRCLTLNPALSPALNPGRL